MKKILGIILFVLAGVFGLSILSQLPKAILAVMTLIGIKETANSTYDVGYSIGQLLALGVLILLVVFLVKSGRRLVRSDKKSKVEVPK